MAMEEVTLKAHQGYFDVAPEAIDSVGERLFQETLRHMMPPEAVIVGDPVPLKYYGQNLWRPTAGDKPQFYRYWFRWYQDEEGTMFSAPPEDGKPLRIRNINDNN